jgi:hypothetical protein
MQELLTNVTSSELWRYVWLLVIIWLIVVWLLYAARRVDMRQKERLAKEERDRAEAEAALEQSKEHKDEDSA